MRSCTDFSARALRGGEPPGVPVHVDPGHVVALKAGRAVGVEHGDEMQAQAV